MIMLIVATSSINDKSFHDKNKETGEYMKITFLGATQTVTGSCYLIEQGDTKLLVDCGLFQGDEDDKQAREPFPIDPKTIDAVILTHAHIDHSGYIPALVKQGFHGVIYCSPATYALCALLLVDSGRVQEQEAQKQQEKASGQEQPLPLYTEQEAGNSLHFFKTVPYNTTWSIGALKAKLIRSEHILGSSFVILSDGKSTVTFSGDLGRPHSLIMRKPPAIKQTDYLVLESTYGSRLHPEEDPLEVIAQVIQKTVEKGGVLIIPAFAVGRTQIMLYCLYLLKQKQMLPDIPIFLDSPLAIEVTQLYVRFSDELILSAKVSKDALRVATYIHTVEQSKKLDDIQGSAIIIAGSGMAHGGRVVNHLEYYISDAKNSVLFVGFQATGTLGRALIDGAKTVTINDTSYEVKADIEQINMLSAHADYREILGWLAHMETAPKKIFLTHGEPDATLSLQQKIKEQFGWPVVVSHYQESFDLD